jgi:uncharacterized oxidoreductase
MKTTGNVILITGGATGIGFAHAEAFAKAGNEVIICGRSEDSLREAKSRLPQIHTRRCDLSRENERTELYHWINSNFKGMNILMNNAGIQRRIDFRKGMHDIAAHRLADGQDEIEINLRSYIDLTGYFAPFLMKQKEAAIINVSSGLGFVPLAEVPVYCATKAAIHSFTLSLRHQLKDTSIKVFEVIPPIVDTGLDKGMRRGDRGIPPSEVAKATMKALEADQFEIPVGMAQGLVQASSRGVEEVFKSMNR